MATGLASILTFIATRRKAKEDAEGGFRKDLMTRVKELENHRDNCEEKIREAVRHSESECGEKIQREVDLAKRELRAELELRLRGISEASDE